jgi:hypothetical protein
LNAAPGPASVLLPKLYEFYASREIEFGEEISFPLLSKQVYSTQQESN